MGQLVNIDGKLYAPEDARISVFDHGFLFGDSIYETMRTYKQKIFLLDRHMERLHNSARMLHLRLPLSTEDFEKELARTVDAASNDECYLRLVVTRGKGKIGLDMTLSEKASYVIFAAPFEPLPQHLYDLGIKVAIVSIRRNDQAALSPRMKSSNLLNNVLAYAEAKQQNAFEGILCNLSGYITEATGSNVFMVRDNSLLTPPLEAGLLEGTTRGLTIELAIAAKIPVLEKNITPEELLDSDECFITSTTKGILPVNCINDRRLPHPPGAVTKVLMRSLDEFVEKLS